MKKLLKFLTATILMLSAPLIISCGDDNEDEIIPGTDEKETTTTADVNPLTVFSQGVPSQVGDMKITKNAKGLVTKIVEGNDVTTFDYTGKTSAKARAVSIPADYDMTFTVKSDDPSDPEVFTFYVKLTSAGYIEYAYEVDVDEDGTDVDEWWFKYNTNGQMIEMKRSKGDNEVTTITYNADGDITKVAVSDDIDGNKMECTIGYTDNAHNAPIANKSGIMLYDYSLRIDMDEMAPAYFAGLLGKGTTHLPLWATEVDLRPGRGQDDYTFTWDINANNMPVKFTSIQRSQSGNHTDVIDLQW